jgi:hypothetical protein
MVNGGFRENPAIDANARSWPKADVSGVVNAET